MVLKPLIAIWLFLCLNLTASLVLAQQPITVEVAVNPERERTAAAVLPRWQFGLELSQPVLMQIDYLSAWERALPLEGLVQYRLWNSPVYAQLYGGYFWGRIEYENGARLEQSGFFLKPGAHWAIRRREQQHALFLEASAFLSLGSVSAQNEIYGPVFGNSIATAHATVTAGGVEAAVGTEFLQLGKYKLRGRFSSYLVSAPAEEVELFYMPGAGYYGFMGFGVGVSLYLMRIYE